MLTMQGGGIRIAIATTTIAVLTACTGTDRGDLDIALVFDLHSDSQRFCAPPSEAPNHMVHVLGNQPVTLSGALYESTDYIDNTFRGLPITRAGVEVALWQQAIDTQQRQVELAVAETDEFGEFTLEWDPSVMPANSGLGFLINGRNEQSLGPKILDDNGSPDQVVCAWWAHPTGEQVVNQTVSRGDDVHLMVQGMGDLNAPVLTIREVGSDLSGDTRVATLDGEAFVDGVSATPWTIAAEEGFLDGNRVELEFSAHTTGLTSGMDTGTVSPWMFAN